MPYYDYNTARIWGAAAKRKGANHRYMAADVNAYRRPPYPTKVNNIHVMRKRWKHWRFLNEIHKLKKTGGFFI